MWIICVNLIATICGEAGHPHLLEAIGFEIYFFSLYYFLGDQYLKGSAYNPIVFFL